MDVPSGDSTDESPCALPFCKMDILYQKSHVRLELVQRTLKNMELSPDEGIV